MFWIHICYTLKTSSICSQAPALRNASVVSILMTKPEEICKGRVSGNVWKMKKKKVEMEADWSKNFVYKCLT